jgi:putative tryptophan/tyrosine transport system substrate-binding protein
VCWSMDPVGSGLVQSVKQPGGHLAAVTWAPGLETAQLRMLRALNPAIDRVGYLYNLRYAPAAAARRNMRSAGDIFRIEVLDAECLDRNGIAANIEALVERGAQAIVLGPHELLGHSGAMVADLAQRHGIPSIGGDPVGTFGHAVTFNPDFERVWAEAAVIADAILRGADPAEIPVSRFIKPLVRMDLAVIARLGLSAPEWMISEVDEVVLN